MKTDELIDLLATNAEPVGQAAALRRHGLALLSSVPATLLLLFVFLGVRADLAEAMRLPMFWVKLLVPVAVAAATLLATARLSRPGARLGVLPLLMATPLLALLSFAAVVLLATAPMERAALILGRTWAACPMLIAALAVPSFVGVFRAMQGLAPTRPLLAGAVAGLLAGSVATAVYALHCPEMAAPFVAVWYLLGMAIPVGVGGFLGPRLLRW